MAITAAKATQSIQEKRYYTLNLLEASFQHGSEVDIYTVQNMSVSDLGAEVFTYNMASPLNTYVIFDERPKPQLLQKYGWYRENQEQIPILAYIPTHLLWLKETPPATGVVSIVNSVLLDGTEMLSLSSTGESDKYKLVDLKIVRGTLIDIKYDFLSQNNLPNRNNRFYVADVKIDTVSLNYIANLVPYKFKESDKGSATSEFSKINFSSEDIII